MENRKRNIQMKFYVTEEEKRLIDEKMKQLPIKQYGAYIRELQAVSRNINQIAKRANATGTVYRQDIEDIKKAVDEIWRLQRRTLLNQP
ncbi:MobC family plasmid mobilization relaxosome protein [Flavonifractor plautii]|uniref:plasmid mobilization relaxosome protein MobC n=1 Tax=Flavonifractor plautii TaxID=292800 RepID=UPI001CD57F1B|nr:plasmid mobilization relaxosome protein MobC [Flavonifractor plautii]UBS60457.1 MobC family plasmid mobilization relaxosome protein [Flavonifractor plautii]